MSVWKYFVQMQKINTWDSLISSTSVLTKVDSLQNHYFYTSASKDYVVSN